MKNEWVLLLAMVAMPSFAGDLWEVASTSAGLDGKPLPFNQRICFPSGGMDSSLVLGGAGNCTFDHKSGDASAMTFAMTCKTPGMPADVEAIKVTGDARLSGKKFDMRYTMAIGKSFSMKGSVDAHKVGQCSER
jgi:hypothetical protein